MDTPTIHEDHWRWRNDDGGESSGGATFKELEDVDHTFVSADLDVNVRLRFSLHVEVATVNNMGALLQYNLNGVGWNHANLTSSVARTNFLSPNFADDDDTTEHGVTFVGSGSFVATNQGMMEQNTTVGRATTAAQDFVAFEINFHLLEADLSDADEVEFRLVETDFTLFTSYPANHAKAIISLPTTIGETYLPAYIARHRLIPFVTR